MITEQQIIEHTELTGILPYTTIYNVPYSGKFSYGAKFCIFCIKLQDVKISTTKIFSMEILN